MPGVVVPTHLSRSKALRYGWGQAKRSVVTVALTGGTVGIAAVVALIQLEQDGLTRKGLSKVVHANETAWIAIGVWLVLVVLWHLWQAPLGLARIVAAQHETRANEAERCAVTADEEHKKAHESADQARAAADRATASLKAAAATQKMPLADRLELALKRGTGLEYQLDSQNFSLLASPTTLPHAREWHDEIYKMLSEAGCRDQAKHWLSATVSIPDADLNFATAGISRQIVGQQVNCLRQIIADLRAAGMDARTAVTVPRDAP